MSKIVFDGETSLDRLVIHDKDILHGRWCKISTLSGKMMNGIICDVSGEKTMKVFVPDLCRVKKVKLKSLYPLDYRVYNRSNERPWVEK